LTVLFCHGNAGNIGDWVWAARACRDMGFGFLVFDYRGYGRSTGRPTEEGTYRDARAAWAYLTGEAGLRPAQIVVHGWSLGGAVAAWLAARETPAALVLESPFSSARDMAGRVFPLLPARLLCRFRYDTVASVRQVRCPVLVAHSPHDETIPYAQGLRVFEAAPEPKRFVELGGAHNGSGFDADPAFRAALLEFLRAPGPLGGK
jgi:pimeloyl-ACP methyl ester carboxylesterase